jgi:proline dehydrogenase|tara:strand:+ start:5577 stop:6746 length:1170 start_codon:yes stop_codon:yes gene_type:complete
MKFNNTQKAYHLKTDKQLKKAFYLFKIISNKSLVFLGSAIARLALTLRLPVSSIFRATVFSQFCAGLDKVESLKVVGALKSCNVQCYLHYAAEGVKTEKGMDVSKNKILETLSFSKESNALPFTVFKATGLGPIALFKKKSAGIPFKTLELEEWSRVITRIDICCAEAEKIGIKMLIDAEESWLQPAIDEIAESLMEKYNQKEPIIYTTLQMYRKDRLLYLKAIYEKATNGGFKVGIKLVRGAYIEKENLRAYRLGNPSPICDSKKLTDKNFNNGIDFILSKLETVSLFIGSHNEESVLKVINWMTLNKVPKDHPYIWFSQLYGMADHISFNLASSGYHVIKYVPYGPVNDVIPYLIRRAEENTSISGQTPRELNLIKKELKRRKTMAV